MIARIYRPTRTAMQSGTAKTRNWVLEFEAEKPRTVEPLMGWTTCTDMRQQVQLRFESKEQAITYCERHGIAYRVSDPHERKLRPMAYADNFSFHRRDAWTH